MKKDSFLRNLFLPFRLNPTIPTILYIYILYHEKEQETQLQPVQDRSIISSRSRFLRRRDEDRDVLSIWRREGLPSVVCNCRSCEGVTHQEQTVYTSGRVFADTGRDDNINRETSVCLGSQRDTRQVARIVRGMKRESTVASKPNVCSVRLSRDYTRLEELRRREEWIDFSQISEFFLSFHSYRRRLSSPKIILYISMYQQR